MQITRNSVSTVKGSPDIVTGDVWLDAVAAAPSPGRAQANMVRYAPGARTAWHTHPLGQTVYIVDGVGLCQRRGGPIEVLNPGDRVFFEPDEDHWHGAFPDRLVTQLTIHEPDESGSNVVWGDLLTEAQYAGSEA